MLMGALFHIRCPGIKHSGFSLVNGLLILLVLTRVSKEAFYECFSDQGWNEGCFG